MFTRRRRMSPAEREKARLHENRCKLAEQVKEIGGVITRQMLDDWEDMAADDPNHPMALPLFMSTREARSIMQNRGAKHRMMAYDKEQAVIKMGADAGWR